MFAEACKISSEYTKPVIISRRHLDGSVESGCAAFVVLNDSGWAITAAHIFDSYVAAEQHAPLLKTHGAELAAIEGDSSLGAKQKAKKMRRVKSDPKWITNHSFWWGRDRVAMPEATVNPELDLAVGRIEPWEAAWVSRYPVIKDPAKEMQPGRSLCRLGFPFSNISSKFNEADNGFVLDKKATPFFPLEGIYTRNVDLGETADGKFRKMLLETSSPGLMGQSGGPVFDIHGAVWAIQSRTHHYDLGLAPKPRRTSVK